ncbi:hypothetical protein [Geodermatophilus sp. SYSU D00710]
MSGLLLRTPMDVLRVRRSDDGVVSNAATDGARAFYRREPGLQLHSASTTEARR